MLTHKLKAIRYSAGVFLLILCHTGLYAQFNTLDTIGIKKEPACRQIDCWDVWRSFWRIEDQEHVDTTRIKKGKVYLTLIPSIGYNATSSFKAVATTNISFCTDEPGHTNLSTIFADFEYTLKRQVILPVNSDVWTKDNRYDFLGDFRFYRYPSVSYGLGGYTTLADADPLDYSYLRVYEVAAKQIVPDFLAGIGYNLDYHYDIEDFGRADRTETDMQKYDGDARSTVSSGLSLNLIYDTRRNNNNPQGGWFGNVIVRPNLTLFGSSNNWQLLYAEFRRYIEFPRKSHNILSFWNFYWFTIGHAPYLDLPATYWDTYENSGRGYVQDRFKGPGMMYFETEYRVQLMRNGLLGGVVFTNFQSFENWPRDNFDNVLPAAGVGLRIKVNKHSNTNACIDYARGLNGSSGVFFNLGEVF